MDYLKYNQAVIPIAAAVPDVVSLLKQINTAPWTWCKTINLENAFVSVTICKDHQQCAYLLLPNKINSPSSQYCLRVVLTHLLSALI